MDAGGRMELIEELCSIGSRGAGTDAERRAANLLAGRLREGGRRVEVEPTLVHPGYALALALTAAVAIAGGLVATVVPPLGFALVLAAAASAYLELNTRAYLARSLLPRRGSQNVVSRGGRPDAPVRLVLSASYDAPRGGYVFGAGPGRLGRRLAARTGGRVGPFRLYLWGGIVPLAAIAGARMAGLDGLGLDLAQLLPTVLLVVAAFLLGDLALSPTTPGAYGNASGVAAVLSAASELDREPPPHLDLWVVLPGAGECVSEGMRAFIRAHRRELDRGRTVILSVEGASFGTPHYRVVEGAAIGHPMDRELVELGAALAAADQGFGARPVRQPVTGGALPAAIRGLSSLSIVGLAQGSPPPWARSHHDLPERVDPEALTLISAYVVGLARLIDRDVERERGHRSGPAR